MAGAMALPAAAQETTGVAELDAAVAECAAVIEMAPDDWIGWRRDFGGGYADSFEFHDGREDDRASVLKTTSFIDGIAREDTSWCYRSDDTLAAISITMMSPDMANGGEAGPLIKREGRIYYDADGRQTRVIGWIADADGAKLGPIGTSAHQLARDCNSVDLRIRAEDAEAEYLWVLGDIEGNHPEYAAYDFDWCAVAEEGP